MLTAAQLKARDGKLTASRVACLMTGDQEKMLNLWREMVGDPAFVAEDLSGVWPIRLGETTEPLNPGPRGSPNRLSGSAGARGS